MGKRAISPLGNVKPLWGLAKSVSWRHVPDGFLDRGRSFHLGGSFYHDLVEYLQQRDRSPEQGVEEIMQLTIERNELLRAMAHVTGVVERRSTIPILSNVKLQADGAALRMTATDLDIEVVETVPAMVTRPGGTTVQALVLHDIVRKLADGAQVDLSREGDEGQMHVSSGHARFALQALTVDDFPTIEAGEMSHRFELESQQVKRLIEKTRFAISTEETRYYLNGIYLHRAETDGAQMLRAVATDGHRLAQVEVPLPEGANGMPGVIIPRKTVQELHRLVENSTDKVQIELSDSKIRIITGHVVLTSKLIDGTFPEYERVIPQQNDKVMQASKSEFTSAVDRVSTISSEKGRAVKLNIGDGKLKLTVVNPDSGTAEEEIDIAYEADPMEIGFNARYLLDISGQLESDTGTFLLSDPNSPTLVRDGEDRTALYVLMPMRV